MRKPNLFILGAPKCGTTSMASWLDEHPQIFMSPIKEPHFYNTDHTHNVVTDKSQYLKLFKNSTEKHKIIGEASVWYLYSEKAVENIINDYGDTTQYIVMLRNPISMAFSLHEQQVFNLNEPEVNFRKAWDLQESRKRNKEIGSTTRDSKLLLYGEACKLGKQVQRLLQKVEREKVKFVLIDDLKLDPKKAYDDILEFLDIDSFNRSDFRPVNTAKVRRSTNLAFVVKAIGLLKKRLNINKGFGFLNKLNGINVVNIKREAIDEEMHLLLRDYFREDIDLLSRLLKKDLSAWLK